MTRSAPVCSSTTARQTRCRNRYEPTTARVSHGRDTSSGPIDISYTRNVSAPYAAHMSSGVTTFFSDLPILPYSRLTSVSPWNQRAVALDDLLGGHVARRAGR